MQDVGGFRDFVPEVIGKVGVFGGGGQKLVHVYVDHPVCQVMKVDEAVFGCLCPMGKFVLANPKWWYDCQIRPLVLLVQGVQHGHII